MLGLCRETGSRMLLVCHTRQIPAHLNAVLAGTGYQLLIGLPQALRAAGPGLRSRPDGAAGAGPDAADLPRFLHPHIRNYRSKAFAQLGPAGFARTDELLAAAWLASLRAPRTRRAYAADMRGWLGWLAERGTDVLGVGPVHVDLWVAGQQDRGAEASTACR